MLSLGVNLCFFKWKGLEWHCIITWNGWLGRIGRYLEVVDAFERAIFLCWGFVSININNMRMKLHIPSDVPNGVTAHRLTIVTLVLHWFVLWQRPFVSVRCGCGRLFTPSYCCVRSWVHTIPISERSCISVVIGNSLADGYQLSSLILTKSQSQHQSRFCSSHMVGETF